MKFLLFTFIFYSSVFSISIEHLENLSSHKQLSLQSHFKHVGLVLVDGFIATGTLIHPKVVLTSAHVVKKAKRIAFSIDQGGILKTVSGVGLSHPNYIGGSSTTISITDMGFDIGLIFLDTPLIDSPYPLLADKQSPPHVPFFATGYGLWKKDLPPSLIERKLTGCLSIQEKRDHLIIASPTNFSAIDLFCNPQLGDSGGPLMTLFENTCIIHGVFSSSFFLKEAKNSPPLPIYTSIYHTRDWILETIDKKCR
jgi:hypothetical protein